MTKTTIEINDTHNAAILIRIADFLEVFSEKGYDGANYAAKSANIGALADLLINVQDCIRYASRMKDHNMREYAEDLAKSCNNLEATILEWLKEAQ